MAVLEILEFPDPRLRNKAKAVKVVDKSIQKLIHDMLETMYNAPGIGLAATQVNVHKRVVVMDISPDQDQPRVFINPKITPIEEQTTESQEGCLSVPGFYEQIMRYEKINVSALDKNGQAFELDCDDLLSVCIQHEVDHLNGKLFVDYISSLKRQRIKKKLEKQHREQN
ncbi:MAG: peptide deformylase [Pseudomonadales bacterium]|nr:peptide deformylase [Pseudomonadales bacterium]